MSDKDRAEHEAWLVALATDGVNLTPWEDEFCESLRERIAQGRSLSEKQAEVLEDIYAKRTP